MADYRGRTAPAESPSDPPRRGRPRLGVVAREVTLLPRHWDWLAGQPGAPRRSCDGWSRMRAAPPPGRIAPRKAREALYRVMSALAGDLPGFEEASRALFADDLDRFEAILRQWPADVTVFLRRLARDQG